MNEEGRTRVLFLCTHNSARSQMAEGILRHLGGDRFTSESAGTQPRSVHRLAIQVMARRGIDLCGQAPKHIDAFENRTFDYAVTVCDNAKESCPFFPGTPQRIHWSIADPSLVSGQESERVAAFERAADDLTSRILDLLTTLQDPASR